MTARGRLACDNCAVRLSAACSVLTEEERAELSTLGTSRSLARGETLFRPGDTPVCATLISGALKLVELSREGEEQIVGLVHPAGFTGELFASEERIEAVALAPSQLCLFPQAAYLRIVERHPKLAAALLQRQSRDLAETRSILSLTATRGSAARVAGLLLSLARAASDSPCHPARQFSLPMSRSDMGDMLGLTIETVSRQLTRLEENGVIRRDGRRGIAIHDLKALIAAAGRD